MIRLAGLAFVLVLSHPMFSQLAHVPEIDERLHPMDIPESASHNLCATAASQAYPCFETSIDGVNFTIAFDDESGRVKYVATSDPGFKTADGYKVGDEIEFPRCLLQVSPYFAVYGPATWDGWRPILSFNLGAVLSGKIPDGDPIKSEIGGFSKAQLLDPVFWFYRNQPTPLAN
jgi:hypothetical protein